MKRKISVLIWATICFVLLFGTSVFAAELANKPEIKNLKLTNTADGIKVEASYESKNGNTWIEVYLLGKEAKEGDIKGPYGLINLYGKVYHLASHPTTINTSNPAHHYKNETTGLWTLNTLMYTPEGAPSAGDHIGVVIETGTTYDNLLLSNPVNVTVPRMDDTVEVSPDLKVVDVPESVTLEYTGKPQTGVPAHEGYKRSETYEATASGKYKAILELNPGYIWRDNTKSPKPVAWEILPEKAKNNSETTVPSNSETTVQPITEKKTNITINSVPKNVKLKSKGGKVSVSWKKIKNAVHSVKIREMIDGVEVRYSKSKTFKKNPKTKKIKSKTKNRITFKLKKGKTYYFKARYFGKTGVSKWTKTKKIKVK